MTKDETQRPKRKRLGASLDKLLSEPPPEPEAELMNRMRAVIKEKEGLKDQVAALKEHVRELEAQNAELIRKTTWIDTTDEKTHGCPMCGAVSLKAV